MIYKQSEKVKQLTQSEIRNMSLECDKVNAINLSQGICDLPLESILAEGALEAMQAGENHYTRYDGVEPLREAIANKARIFNNIDITKDNIVVSAGATGALYSTCYALFSPGDEIILFEPYYGYHEYTFLSLGLIPVFVKLELPDWLLNFDALQSIITPKTKAIMICTPSNPCGKVYTKQELEQLGEFCIKNNLIALTDEIYEYITYDNRVHISPASLPQFKGRTVTISGYSKTFSITGWRIGYCIADAEICKWIGNANDLLYVCAPAPLQFGTAKAINSLDNKFYSSLKNEFIEKRDIICNTLNEIGLTPYTPQGAYYVLADVSMVPGIASKEKAIYILNKTGVGSVPGDAFYHGNGGLNLVRFCFAKEKSIIEEACERLKKI